MSDQKIDFSLKDESLLSISKNCLKFRVSVTFTKFIRSKRKLDFKIH